MESAVFDTFGLLELILSYSTADDLLQASLVSQRWKDAARNDFLWIDICKALWEGKAGMSHLEGTEEVCESN